jgi:hypothetical protein
LLNFALKASKKYNEEETVEWTKKIVKYLVFLSEGTKIDADGNLFSNDDVKRILTFYQIEIENQNNEKKNNFDNNDDNNIEEKSFEEKNHNNHFIIEKLRDTINLSKSYRAPLKRMDSFKSDKENGNKNNNGKKGWSWG